MLNYTTTSDRLEEAALKIQEAIAIMEQARAEIVQPEGLAWSPEYSIRQRLNGMKHDSRRIMEEISRLHLWTYAVSRREGGRYEQAS